MQLRNFCSPNNAASTSVELAAVLTKFHYLLGTPGCLWNEGGILMPKAFQLAPDKLWQAINPLTFYQQGAQFGFINIDLGNTQHPGVEQTILDEVGSYGRQLGRIGDALEVILKHVKLEGLSQDEKDAVTVLEGQLAQVRQIKERALREK
jgi:hypothetical protein